MTEKPSELLPEAAIHNLTNHQQQLDMDGIMVGVSRQALEEVLDYIATTLPVERGVLEELKREADSAYCRALDLADKNCRGQQYKLENGLFGNDDLNWHCKHNELIGYHRGIYAALAKIDLILEKKNG